MAIRTHDCVTLVCDVCGKDIAVELDDGVRHFSSPTAAREEINEFFDEDTEAWPVSVDGIDLCSTCRNLPHDYVPIDRPYRGDTRCMRCLVGKDDHDGEV